MDNTTSPTFRLEITSLDDFERLVNIIRGGGSDPLTQVEVDKLAQRVNASTSALKAAVDATTPAP